MIKMSLVKSIRKRQRQGIFPVISELKVRSEKAGDLLKGRDPIALVKEMNACPVAGISVVTEPLHFGGSLDLLKRVANAVSFPVLHKDFIGEGEQIKESKRLGASAILLIASILDQKRLEVLIEAAKRYGMEVLLEVHTRKEMDMVKDMEFDLIGINNRDIKVLETDDTGVELTESLVRYCSTNRPFVSESAIGSADDVKRVKEAGADAVLVGTAVMLSNDMKGFLNRLAGVGWSE